jgi:branched-chain amino acid transport system ATP-binding protein
VLLELDHVTKKFGSVVVADELSLAIEQGDIVGIVGPNGAGKTSVFGLIGGDLTPDSGEIRFDGRTVTRLNGSARCRLGIGRTYQVPRPFTDMTGSFVGDGRPADVLANPAVREVFLGTEVTTSLAGPAAHEPTGEGG